LPLQVFSTNGTEFRYLNLIVFNVKIISLQIVHKGPVRKSHMATRGKLNYLPSQVFCNEGHTTILVEMWEKMSEKLNLWKDEEIKR
jgi:hypothetical protein